MLPQSFRKHLLSKSFLPSPISLTKFSQPSRLQIINHYHTSVSNQQYSVLLRNPPHISNLVGKSFAVSSIAPVPSDKFRPFATSRSRKKFSWADKSPYEILNVPTNANSKEIKVAYFREAKKYHPDLNPTDPEAKEKFQAIAAAYEILSDESKRRMYDTNGFTGQGTTGNSGGGSQYYQQQSSYTQQQAEEVFRTVQEDFDIVQDALKSYSDELRDEMNVAVDAIRRQDWETLWDITKAHSALIATVVVPTVLLLRYPPAVFAVLRVVWAGANIAVAGLLYTGNLHIAARFIWKKIVNLSLEQKHRAAKRKQS
jgi:hypothetical protein